MVWHEYFQKIYCSDISFIKNHKNFWIKESRFFHQSWKNRFLLKPKSPNKKRSADSKSALNSEFNYVLHYIWLWVRHGVRSILYRFMALKQTCAESHFFKEKSSQVIQKSSHDLTFLKKTKKSKSWLWLFSKSQ